MNREGKVLITDYGFKHVDQERKVLEGLGYEVVAAQCATFHEVLELGRHADALMVQWAPVPRTVIEQLDRCKVIVRYGIGVDNVDLLAAAEKRIPVCNVPDYCISEVADHSMALALALARQLNETGARMRRGVWKITPPHFMAAFREMHFVTIGYGRIAREVLKRAAAFGFNLAAYDPYVSAADMEIDDVTKFTLEEAIVRADLLSLHIPLNKQTHHLINEDRLRKMKRDAILVNTSRGGLVDTVALAGALQRRQIAGAGIDVFENEPLPTIHPLWACHNAVLTSHTAWYSESSVPTLQRMAADEVARALLGEPLKNRVS